MTIATRSVAAPSRHNERPLVVALTGLAGTGKSSLARALMRLDPGIRARPRVSVWRYLANVPPLIPTFLRLHYPLRGVLWKEMKRILRLHALRRMVHETTDCDMLVFDEGPVYLLARILVYGGAKIRTRNFEESWRRWIAMWAGEFDAIVMLQAPEDLLAARLRARRRHPFQDRSDAAVRALFRDYSDAFTRVIGELTAAGAPRPWTVQTNHGTVDETARDLLIRLGALRGPAYGPRA